MCFSIILGLFVDVAQVYGWHFNIMKAPSPVFCAINYLEQKVAAVKEVFFVFVAMEWRSSDNYMRT